MSLLPVGGTALAPLPVSGTPLTVREPTGLDEVFLVETALPPLAAFLELAGRVAGTGVDWAGLPAPDIGAAALGIRRAWFGELIRSEAWCPDPGCRERIDVSFGVGDYLRHHRPHRPRGVVKLPGEDWYSLAHATVRFRVPAVADLLAAMSDPEPAEALSSRCIDAVEIPRALARRLDRALSALAPNLDDVLGGECPGCGQQVAVRFDPLGYTLAEARNAFSSVFLETHALASAYGWPEEGILALPRSRRRRYASVIASERLAG
jgi:hypothetical protein